MTSDVLNFVFPGDLIALQSVLMKEALHSVEATTEMTFCIFERDALWKTFCSEPERAYALIGARDPGAGLREAAAAREAATAAAKAATP